MEQENIYENEIDLKELLYKIFKKWRGIIICAVIFALLAGGYKALSFSSGDAVSALREEYEKTLNDYEEQKAELQNDIRKDEENIKEFDAKISEAKISTEDWTRVFELKLAAESRIQTNEQSLNELLANEPEEFSQPSSGAAKYAVLGFVLGGFLAVFAVCVAYLMSDRVRNLKEVWRRFGLKGLCQFTDEKKKGCPVDRLIDRLFGVKKPEAFLETGRIAAANVANYIDRESKNILVTGSVSKEDIKKAADILSKEAESGLLSDNKGLSFIAADLITKPETIKSLASCDEVILVERAGRTTAEDIEEELISLKNLDKKITGIILF